VKKVNPTDWPNTVTRSAYWIQAEFIVEVFWRTNCTVKQATAKEAEHRYLMIRLVKGNRAVRLSGQSILSNDNV